MIWVNMLLAKLSSTDEALLASSWLKCTQAWNYIQGKLSDIRNTRAIDVYKELISYNVNVDVFNPWASTDEVRQEFGFLPIDNIDNKKYHSVILTVAHKEYVELNLI